MGDFIVRVIKAEGIYKHPNADSLSVLNVYGGFPVIFNHNDNPLKDGMKAIYVSVDALVPTDREEFAWLASPGKTHERIKAKKIRGIFSMGMLVPCDQNLEEGTDMQAALGITKYEPPIPMSTGGQTESPPANMPVYDIDGLRRYNNAFKEGEEVIINEKLHGTSSRYVFMNERLYCSSHYEFKKPDDKNMWWVAAKKYNLAEKLALKPNFAFYGEVYGTVQDLKYAAKQGELFWAGFDIIDLSTLQYLDYDDFVAVMKELDLPMVPELYRGPWNEGLRELSEGKTTIHGADHVREGIVIRPAKERWDERVGRMILKLHGQGYLLRKQKD